MPRCPGTMLAREVEFTNFIIPLSSPQCPLRHSCAGGNDDCVPTCLCPFVPCAHRKWDRHRTTRADLCLLKLLISGKHQPEVPVLKLRISVCIAATCLLSPKSFAGLQMRMTKPRGRKRFGGEGRVRRAVPARGLEQKPPHPACRRASAMSVPTRSRQSPSISEEKGRNCATSKPMPSAGRPTGSRAVSPR
jgi:hypothetical protein